MILFGSRRSWWLIAAVMLAGCTQRDAAPSPPSAVPSSTAISPSGSTSQATVKTPLSLPNSTPSSTRPIAARPSVDDPLPWFWLTTSCNGECLPDLPDGLANVVVYPDGRYMLVRAYDPLSVVRGQLPSDQLTEFEMLFAATGIARDTSVPAIPLGTFRPTEPTDGYFTARVGDHIVIQRVEDLWHRAPEATADRRPYEELAAWIERLQQSIPKDGWGTGDRWVAIASSRLGDFGDVDWTAYESSRWCAVFSDAQRVLAWERFETWAWVRPSGVISLRPALPHETDCAAVAAWDALR